MVEVEHSVDAAATRSGFMGRARDLAVEPDPGHRHRRPPRRRLRRRPGVPGQLLAAGDDRRRHLQHHHPRARCADRSCRHGLAVPVRPRGVRRVGRAAAELRHLTPLPRPRHHRRAHHGGHRRPHRPAGAAAVRPLPGPHHADGGRGTDDPPHSGTVPQRRRRVLRQLLCRRRDLAAPPAVHRQERRRVLPLLRGGGGRHVRHRRMARPAQAGASLGVVAPEREQRGRSGRQHHPLQAVGVRAGLVLRRRRRRAPGRRGRWSQHQPVPGLELGHPPRRGPHGRRLQPGRRHRRRALPPPPARAARQLGRVDGDPDDPVRHRRPAGPADGPGRDRRAAPPRHGPPGPEADRPAAQGEHARGDDAGRGTTTLTAVEEPTG